MVWPGVSSELHAKTVRFEFCLQSVVSQSWVKTVCFLSFVQKQQAEEAMETKSSSVTLLHNALIVTMDSETRVFYNGAIVVEKDRIIALGQSHNIFNQFAPLAQNVFDLHGQILLPGALSVSRSVWLIRK